MHLTLTPDELAFLDTEAKAKGISREDLIVEVLRDWLERKTANPALMTRRLTWAAGARIETVELMQEIIADYVDRRKGH